MGIVIGIDPGSRRTGFGVLKYQNDDLECLEFGVFEPKSTLSYNERIFLIGQGLRKILAKYKPDVMAIEKAFFAKNADSALKLGQMRGICIYEAACHKAKVFEYAATEVKLALVGRGRAEKDSVQMVVRAVLNLPPMEVFDMSDALALAIHHARHSDGIARLQEQGLEV
jgi:crossover junction endodeoxyribonuclease RuvC